MFAKDIPLIADHSWTKLNNAIQVQNKEGIVATILFDGSSVIIYSDEGVKTMTVDDIIIGFNWVNFRFMSFIIVKNEITLVYNKYRTSKNKMCISQFEEFKDTIVEFKLGRS